MHCTTIGENIRRLRQERAMPQRKLAKLSQVGLATLQRFERGGNPTAAKLYALARVLGVPASELLRETDSNE